MALLTELLTEIKMINGQSQISIAPPRLTADPIIVVSGLPRSGTSMLMQMLAAGGIPIYCDAQRQADIDNPRGYYELARLKELTKEKDNAWMGMAQGKAVKIISHLLPKLPNAYMYKTVLMNRNLHEVLASQNKMLARRGRPVDTNVTAKLRALFEEHLHHIKSWLGQQSNFEVIEIEYQRAVNDPARHARQLQGFLDIDLHVQKMAAVPDEKLYRNR